MDRRLILSALVASVVIIGLGTWLAFRHPSLHGVSQVSSPLIINQLPSPLPKPLPDGLVGNGPPPIQLAAVTPLLSHSLYLPYIQNGSGPCGMTGVAADLATLFITDPGQLRASPLCDPRVIAAAQYRADDMQKNRYSSHKDLTNHYANYWVDQFGCKLPGFYPPNDNNVESIALNYVSARDAWNNLLLSEAHKVHILGLEPFYRSQNRYGIGYSSGEYGRVYVIITVPPCG